MMEPRISVVDVIPFVSDSGDLVQYEVEFTLDGRRYNGIFHRIGDAVICPFEFGKIQPDGTMVMGAWIHEDRFDGLVEMIRPYLLTAP